MVTLFLGLATAHADRVLTLDDALAMARAHNRDLRAAHARLDQTQTGVESARASLLPTVSAQGKYTHNYKEVDLDLAEFSAPTTALAEVIHGTTTNPAEAAAIAGFEQQSAAALAAQPPIVIQKSEQLDFALTATVPLIAPAAYLGLRAANLSAHAGEASYDANLATVLLGVAQTYFAAAGADELVTARTDAVGVATETWQNAKARVAADLANQVDVTRAETALVRAQQAQAEAENLRAQTYRALGTQLGTREVLHVQPLASAPATPAAVDELVANAEHTRPELIAQRATNDAATANAHAGSWRWSPTLSAFGNLRAFNYTGFSGDKYSWAIGLELDWLLYDGGARDAQRHLAEAQRREGEAKLELLVDSVADEVANARGTLETKRKSLATATRAAELARETLRLVRAQYEAGTTRQLDVLEAQDTLVSADVDLAQARFDLALADLQLQRADGSFPKGQR